MTEPCFRPTQDEYPDFVAFGPDAFEFGIQAAPDRNDPPSVLTWQLGVSDVDLAADLWRKRWPGVHPRAERPRARLELPPADPSFTQRVSRRPGRPSRAANP